MGKCKSAKTGHQHHRLGIANTTTTRRRIAVVADRQITRHPSQNVLIKHLAHQAHIFVQEHFVLVKDSDTSGFLAAVLQGVKTEIRQIGNRLLGR